MKKLLIPLVIVLLSALIYLNLLSYKAPKEIRLITQNKVYSIKDDNNLNILIYANKKTAYQDESLIKDIFLTSKDETKKITLTLNKITSLSNYKYLNESYKAYNYNLMVPLLNEYFNIESAYLFIRLKNGHEKLLSIGSFDYYIEKDNLNINELFGRRYDDFPSLSSISMKFSLNEDIYIDHIYLSKDIFVSVNKIVSSDELLTVSFAKQTKLIDNLAIKITYQINGSNYETVLPNHLFYETNENPLEYGILNNVYIID